MPRPRFDKLEPERQAAILAVATEEFAEHGFEGASYNRIIERCGLSKGAMYYYFDDKEDLFVTALGDALQRLIVQVGNVDAATSADEFWHEVAAWYRRSLALVQSEPATIGLVRSLIRGVERGSTGSALEQLRRLGRQHLVDFVERGQRVGAIRGDLPDELLLSLLSSLEEGIDRWLIDRVAELDPGELDELATTLTALYRRVAEAEATPRPNRPRRARKRK